LKGTVSFHPLDLSIFDDLVSPLLSGKKINPDPFVSDAVRIRRNAWQSRRYPRALETALRSAEPPPPDPDAGLWQGLRARMERYDYRPSEVSRRALAAVEPDLHLRGRPFFVAEGTPERVADAVDAFAAAPSPEAADGIAKAQLAKLDAVLAQDLEPEDGPPVSSEMSLRSDLLAKLARLHELAGAARQAQTWSKGEGAGRPAIQVLQDELAWSAVSLHARVVPFWSAVDVDGLETVCRATGIAPPSVLAAPWRLFPDALEEFPSLKESLHAELGSSRDVGAFVSAGDVPELLEFLTRSGARIISAATKLGEGPACKTLLRKIRECATFAARHGFAYLEASGVPDPDAADEG
jgi:hypothetical protein